MICGLSLALCRDTGRAGGCASPGEEQHVLQLGPLLSQPLGDKGQVYPSTLTQTHVKVSVLLP